MGRPTNSRAWAAGWLAMVLVAMPARAIDIHIVSGSTWRTSAVEVAGWETTTFDDSGWASARSPYPGITSPQSLMPGTLAEPIWHDPTASSNGMSGPDTAFLRYSFSIASETDLPVNAIASVNADDDYRLFVNGQLVHENADGGNPDLVDQVDVSSYLRTGLNTFAVMASDGSLDHAYERFYERVLFDAHIQTVATSTRLNGVSVSPDAIPPLVAGDVLQAQGRLGAALQVGADARIVGTNPLLVSSRLGMSNGAVEMAVGGAFQLGAAATLEGHGTVEGKVTSAAGGIINVKAGNLRLGAAAQANAVDLDGDIQVEKARELQLQTKDTARLGGRTALAGGTVKVEEGKVVQLKPGAQVQGYGGMLGTIAGAVGSAIQVREGDLTIGDSAKSDAVAHDGDIEVAKGSKLTAESRTAASLGGTVSLDDGTLQADGGIFMKEKSRLTGSGQVAGGVTAAGVIAPGHSLGELHFTNDLALEATSLLDMEIGHHGGTPDYDRILVDGALDLGGAIRISLTGGYRPVVGDVMDFLIADVIRRSFDSIEFIAQGVTWVSEIVTLADQRQAWRLAVTSVQSVDEPPGLLLAALALLASTLGGRRVARARFRSVGMSRR
ncbi:MAG: hypothetical protein U1F52_02700 [Burkholderiales bacterium]